MDAKVKNKERAAQKGGIAVQGVKNKEEQSKIKRQVKNKEGRGQKKSYPPTAAKAARAGRARAGRARVGRARVGRARASPGC